MVYKGTGANASRGAALALRLIRQQPQQHGHTGSKCDKILDVGKQTDHQQTQPYSKMSSGPML